MTYTTLAKDVEQDIARLAQPKQSQGVVFSRPNPALLETLREIKKTRFPFALYNLFLAATCIFGFWKVGLLLWQYYFPLFGASFAAVNLYSMLPKLRKKTLQECQFTTHNGKHDSDPLRSSPVKEIRNSQEILSYEDAGGTAGLKTRRK